MCSSLQPVNQATHCAKIVLSAAVGPYNSDRLKWRSSSIHCKYRFGPYVAPNAKIDGPMFSLKIPSAYSMKCRRTMDPVGTWM